MQKLKIKITGKKLHDVGYRIPLINEALSLGINNFNTFNANLEGAQAVITIIEADDEIIEEFKDFINTFHPEKATVEKVVFEKYNNNVPPIERVMQSFQMEQWGKGIPILLKISETLDNNTSILKENTSILKDFKNETNDNFNDMKMIMSKHDADASERILSIKREITGIKERLSDVEIAVSEL
ncbi:MAG: acylphosphatase [Euryarchaeota archaeon]|nr:acylphosphatase [Euryarchaeota archaeon]